MNMTFIYELDLYSVKYTGCANMNFLRQGSSDRETYIRTNTIEIIYHAVSRVVNTRSSATAKSTARPSCLVGVLCEISHEKIC